MAKSLEKYHKFKIRLKEIKTGEAKELEIQINQPIETVEVFVKYLFNLSEYELLGIDEIPSIVQIAIEPYCTN